MSWTAAGELKEGMDTLDAGVADATDSVVAAGAEAWDDVASAARDVADATNSVAAATNSAAGLNALQQHVSAAGLSALEQQATAARSFNLPHPKNVFGPQNNMNTIPE